MKSLFFFLLIGMLLSACAAARPPVKGYLSETEHLLATNPVAEGTYRACLYQMYNQGLGIQHAANECWPRLEWQFEIGKFRNGVETYLPAERTGSDVPSSAGGCASIDPTISGGSPQCNKAAGYCWGGVPGGEYVNPNTGQKYVAKGLTEPGSRLLKEEAIADAGKKTDEYFQALNRWGAAQRAYDANPTEENKKKLEEAKEAVHKASNEEKKAKEKAKADPNAGPIPNTQPNPTGEAPCAEALEGARQFIAECNRTNWQTYSCQKLKARMQGCPDPALIYVDPSDSDGIDCGSIEADPAEIARAWKQHCEAVVRYVPGEQNPCEEPKIEGGFMRIQAANICSDPKAHFTDNACLVEFNVTKRSGFGTRDIQQILILSQRKLGGPIVLLPQVGPPGGPHPPY